MKELIISKNIKFHTSLKYIDKHFAFIFEKVLNFIFFPKITVFRKTLNYK